MELLMKEVKGYSDREEDVEEEEAEIRDGSCNKYYPFFSTSSPSSTNYKTHHHHHQNSWLGLHDHHSPEATTTTESHNSSSGLGLHHQDAAPPASNFINLMDLSLGNKNDEVNFHGGSSSNTGHNCNDDVPIEKEHMFDKVVTPSDVGKLNRLVIPKQHAEKYFPLDSSSNEKGLLLNFEDQNGKLWRFRYSYWNSSQSYVMTKGWSRFVKEKKLDAGDIVSFRRGVGELYRHRLYIDWRRRPDHHQYCPDHPTGTLIAPLLLPNHQPHLSQYSIRWGGRLYSLPSPSPARHHEHLQQLNYNNMFLHQHQHQHQHQFHYNEVSSGSGSVYYLRSASTMGDQNLMGQQDGGNNAPMIIDSVPVSHHHRGHPHHGKNSSTSTAAKRLRLFGVNMECASSSSSSTPAEEPKFFSLISSSSTSSVPPYLRVPHEDPLSSSARFQNQEGETAMLFDLDPSLQYRQ